MRGARPSLAASSCTAPAQPAGSSPPALETTLMPRSKHVPSTCSIWVRKVRAQPPPRPPARVRAKINMVSSANQSPVR